MRITILGGGGFRVPLIARQLAAIARFAMPPGHDPMPVACTSVPRSGSEDKPVKTTSKNTVPLTKRSNVWSCIAPPRLLRRGGR